MSRSYTWGSPEGVQAAIDALPARYPMELTADDMEALIRALAWVADSAACYVGNGNENDHATGVFGRECLDTCWRMRAASLVGTIAETLGCDWI